MQNRPPVATTTSPQVFYTYLPQHGPVIQQQAYNDPVLGSLAYRPLGHQSGQQVLQQLHHVPQQQQQRVTLAPFQCQQPHPTFAFSPSLIPQCHSPNYPTVQTRQQARRARMMATSSADEELAELQKLSNEYEPEVTGPLVGVLQPSTAITTEYASADPIYQTKTANLPQKYSHYRTVRGDGSCGWRAIAFGYFETLIALGDSNKFLEEEGRLRSLSNVLTAAGFQTFLIEDFADETFDLLRKLSDALPSGGADELLLQAFNDELCQNYILTYLRSLTVAWMKTHQQDYSPWLPGQTIEEYCNSSITPVSSEIDNVGISALRDVFLSAAGITLEILYLDRSQGSEVNMHRYDPVGHDGFNVGTIRLLYRPGHYDLLYKHEVMALPPQQQNLMAAPVSTYLQYSNQPHAEPAYAIGVPDFLTSIPGMSFAPTSQQNWMSPGNFSSPDFFNSAVAQPTPQSLPPPPTSIHQQQVQQAQPVYAPSPVQHMMAPPMQMSQELAIRAHPHSQQQHNASSPSNAFQQPGGPFRSSIWELQPDFVHVTSQVPLQTSIFRNSHFNTAHFLNPDFQPEEWSPDDEYVTSTSSGRSSRHRSSG